ncbi:MAG: NADH:flavin oxidoreductase [Erysipelotrichaceae bacterium]
MKKVFEEFKIRQTFIKNRLVVPPMVNFNISDESGLIKDEQIAHYQKLAAGGFGLIVVEACSIGELGKLHKSQIGLYNNQQIFNHQRLVNAIHYYDCVAILQIQSSGIFAVDDDLKAPSAYMIETKSRIRAAKAYTKEELDELKEQFIQCGIRAYKCGYEGIELHGCHNYLISQLYNKNINQRNDEYSVDKISGHLIDIIKKIRSNTNDKFIVGIRLGAYEPNLSDGINHAQELVDDVDYISVSTGFSYGHNVEVDVNFPYNEYIYGAYMIKKYINKPVFAVNEINTFDKVLSVLKDCDVDGICIGRQALVNPNFGNDMLEYIKEK